MANYNIDAIYNGSTSLPGTERVRIDGSGNVGIGTTSPNANLHVSGTFQVGNGTNFGNKFTLYESFAGGKIGFCMRDTNGDDIYSILCNSTTGEARLIADDDNGTAFMTFQMNASERMRITNGGNVGIGTTSPTSKLDVTGGNIELDPNQYISFNNAGTVPKIGYRTSGPQAGLDLYDNAGLLTISLGNQAVGIGDYAGGNALPVKGLAVSGNVGIGTATPFGTAANRTVLSVNGTTDVSLNIGSGGSQRAYLYGVSSYAELGTIGSLPLTFAPNNSEKMRLTSDGNLGIGTSSPSDLLNLVTVNGAILYDNSAAGGSKVKIGSTGLGGYVSVLTSGKKLFLGTVNSDINLNTNTGIANYDFNFNATGNLGIGTTSPAAKLHVNGSTTIVGDTATTQNVRQTIVGSTTGNASTTAKKIFVCGHTSTGTINVTAIITSATTASATATFSFANAYGNSVTPNRLSYVSLNSTITSIDCSYNNTGYQMEIAVTYTGATSPTLYFTAEGMGSSIWTL